MFAYRQQLATEYLAGDGLEIGALHGPLQVPEAANVSYVDRLSVADLRDQYPELAEQPLVDVDILDDGEKLTTIKEQSQDFIIANHMLEHCENPIGTIRQHCTKLKPGGIAYYAVPDKRFTFDKDRPLTDFQHLLLDDILGPEGVREAHFREYVLMVDKSTGDKAAQCVKDLMAKNYSIHFHVWDAAQFYEFILRTNEYLGNRFTLKKFAQNESEVICILENTPDPDLSAKLAALTAEKAKLEKRAPSVPLLQRVKRKLARMAS